MLWLWLGFDLDFSIGFGIGLTFARAFLWPVTTTLLATNETVRQPEASKGKERPKPS